MEWHLFKADENRKKWSIRGTRFDGIDVKIPGHRNKVIAEEMRRNIERLNRAKEINDSPSAEILAWLDNQPEKTVNRLVDHNLIDRRRLNRRLPLNDFLPDFEKFVAANAEKPNSRYPKMAAKMVRRIFAGLSDLISFENLTPSAVKQSVHKMRAITGDRRGQPLSTKQVREYYVAIKMFAEFVRKATAASTNPLIDLELSKAKEKRVVNRRPFSYDDFSALIRGIETEQPSKVKHRYWTSYDRQMLYWAAVTTGIRQQELLKLTRADFDFDKSPATITIRASVAKNGLEKTLPIPGKLSSAIKNYTERRLPSEMAFHAPQGQEAIMNAFRKDCDRAGVCRKFPNGDKRDFHTFRSTAICWWLLSGMNLLDVKYLARLETLELVQEYVRRYLPDHQKLIADIPDIEIPQKAAIVRRLEPGRSRDE